MSMLENAGSSSPLVLPPSAEDASRFAPGTGVEAELGMEDEETHRMPQVPCRTMTGWIPAPWGLQEQIPQ